MDNANTLKYDQVEDFRRKLRILYRDDYKKIEHSSRELSLAFTKLQEAHHWLEQEIVNLASS